MNRLTTAERTLVVKALMDGMSVRATVRLTGVSKNTIQKLALDLGAACWTYSDATIRNLQTKRIEADEIWSFVYSKQKNVPASKAGEFGVGDVWTWKAIDADSKLIISWLVGPRDGRSAASFIGDLKSRLAVRPQITTDGLAAYIAAIETEFGADVDYAQLIKQYANTSESDRAQHRYSPGHCTGAVKAVITGSPDEDLISTSYAERENLTQRMSMRRFTRLTNGFSKKIQNHCAAISMYIFHYNFCRVHQALRVTPAMEAGVASHPWDVEEMVALLDAMPATEGLVKVVNAAGSN